MDEGSRADDRLPWIEVPRQRSKPVSATRRAVGPLLLVLGLFVAGGVAVMAFLAGRGAEPLAEEPRPGRPSATITPAPAPAPTVPRPEPVPVPAPLPTIAPTTPVAAPEPKAAPVTAAPVPKAEPAAPVAAAPEPAAAPVREPATPRPEEATRPTSTPVAPPATAVVPRITLPATAPTTAPATPPLYRWPSAAGPSGRVIQLGAYPNGRQTMAAWRRLSRAYPYLATLPRKVIIGRAGPGRRLYYRLRIGAQSSGHARSICDNLHRIGRGCIIV